MRVAVALAFALLSLSVEADPQVYRIDPALTMIEFVATQFGVFPAHGHFARMSGHFVYDAIGQAGSVDFDLAASSVATGWTARDAFIRGEDMFDADRHPVIRFRSTQFVFAQGKPARIDGHLTLRGVRRPLSLTIAHFDCGKSREDGRDACSAEVSGIIHRSEFGMDFLVPIIGDDVELRLMVTVVRE